MRWKATGFGSIEIDGVVYQHDVVVDRGKIRRRRKKPSKAFRGRFGHTPLSLAEDIPWRCDRLIVGTGAEGGLPIMDEVLEEARRRHVEVLAVRTPEAVSRLDRATPGTNAIVHVTC